MSVPKEVRDAVVSAYYRRVMTSSDTARARAQAAYGIASVIAAGVIAAGLFGGLHDSPDSVQATAVAALVAWLAAAALFLHAVSSPFEPRLEPQSSEDAFVEAALEAVRKERSRIDSWQRKAQMAAAIAALVTVVSFVTALRVGDEPRRTVTVTLTAAGAAAMKAVCGRALGNVTGEMAETAASDRLVAIELEPGACGSKSVDVALRRGHILALAFRP